MQVTLTHRNSLTGYADGGRSTTIIGGCLDSSYCIVYSPKKYRETEGKKDLGSNFWNKGKTKEISQRVTHI